MKHRPFLLGFVLSASAFADPSPEAEKFLAVEDTVTSSLKMAEEKFPRASLPGPVIGMLDGLAWEGDGSAPDSFQGQSFDLNGDGSKEYFIKMPGGGSGGPAYLVMGQLGSGWAKLCDFQGYFVVLKSEEGSWPGIVAISKGGGGSFCKRHFELERGEYVETLRENFRNGEVKKTEWPNGKGGVSSAEDKETWAFGLAGYIPKFSPYFEGQEDPFAEPASEKTPPRQQWYADDVQSYLRDNGIRVASARFEPRVNALFLTDTTENLVGVTDLLSFLFSPDLQLSGIETARLAIKNDRLFEGERRLSSVLIIEDLTVRTFHNEILKLKESLKDLPPEHEERSKIEARLAIAKKYLDSSRRLYLESLDKQEALIKEWQTETLKTGQDGRGPTVPPAEPRKGP